MGDFDLDVDVDMDRRGGGYGRPYDEDRTRAGGYGPGPGGPEQGPPRSGRNTVSGHDLLSGRGRDSEGRPIEPQGQYVVTRDRGAERPPERRVLVEVPERALSQLPPGARVVDGGQPDSGRHRGPQGGGIGVEYDGRDGDVNLDVDARSDRRGGGLFGRRG